jgi:hypothetical protein
MSKLARALALAAMVAAINLAGLPAIAQTHAADRADSRPPTDRHVATPQQAAADTAHRRELAQERYYSTWKYGDTSAPDPVEPSGQGGWLTPALGVLAAVLALVAGVAVIAARRASRSQRAGQTV